jgi:hypothetical protein
MASEYGVLRSQLSKANFPAVIENARINKRALSFLTALTYDQDKVISWRAVEAIGLSASQIAEHDPEYVRNHLRRLVWLLNDESGGIGWRAPEAMGEVLYHRPGLFAAFIPILVNLMDMEPKDAQRFRSGWLWAMSRLARVLTVEIWSVAPRIMTCLEDKDPQVRGMAVWCFRKMEYQIPQERLDSLSMDEGTVEVYHSPNLEIFTVSDLLKMAGNEFES